MSNKNELVPGAEELLREGKMHPREERTYTRGNRRHTFDVRRKNSNITATQCARVEVETKYGLNKNNNNDNNQNQNQNSKDNNRVQGEHERIDSGADESATLLRQVRKLELLLLRRNDRITQLANQHDLLLQEVQKREDELQLKRKAEKEQVLTLSRISSNPRTAKKLEGRVRRRIEADLAKRLVKLGFEDLNPSESIILDSDLDSSESDGQRSESGSEADPATLVLTEEIFGTENTTDPMINASTIKTNTKLEHSDPTSIADLNAENIHSLSDLFNDIKIARAPTRQDILLDKYDKELETREELLQQRHKTVKKLEFDNQMLGTRIEDLESHNTELVSKLDESNQLLETKDHKLAASAALEFTQSKALEALQQRQYALETCIAEAQEQSRILQGDLTRSQSQLKITELEVEEEKEKSQTMWQALVADSTQPCNDCVARKSEKIEYSAVMEEAANVHELATIVHKQVADMKAEHSDMLHRRIELLRKETLTRKHAERATQEIQEETLSQCGNVDETEYEDNIEPNFNYVQSFQFSNQPDSSSLKKTVVDEPSVDITTSVETSLVSSLLHQQIVEGIHEAEVVDECTDATSVGEEGSNTVNGSGKCPDACDSLRDDVNTESETVSPACQPNQSLAQHALKTGHLMVCVGNGFVTRFKRRWVVLSPDLLLVFKTTESDVPYRVAGLRNARIRQRRTLSASAHVLQLITGANLSFLLKDTSPEGTDKWEEVLNDCVLALRGNSANLTAGLSVPETGGMHGTTSGLAESYYAVLHVSENASHEQIMHAFQDSVAKCSPDDACVDENNNNSSSQFRTLCSAWSILGDATRRAAYDQGVQTHRKLTRGFVCNLVEPDNPGGKLANFVSRSRKRSSVSGEEPVFLYADVRLTRIYWQVPGARACLFNLARSLSLRAIRKAIRGENFPHCPAKSDQCVVLELEDSSASALCIFVDSQTDREELLLGLHTLLPWLRA